MWENIIKRICIIEDYIRQFTSIKFPTGAAVGQVLTWDGSKVIWADIPDGTTPETDTFVARWGWRNTNTTPSTGDIAALQGSGTFNSDATVVANFSGAAGVPYYLLMAEPLTEPVKTKWYADSLNNETIGTESAFLPPVTVGTYRVYISAFQTDFSLPIEFRIS